MRNGRLAAVLGILLAPGFLGCASTDWIPAQFPWPWAQNPQGTQRVAASRIPPPQLVRPAPLRNPLARRPVGPNPVIVPIADFELVWNRTIAILDEYFDIASENRLSRRIVTDPKIGATVFEPWHGDSVGFRERVEATLQTIHRFAIASVTDAPGGYAVRIEVYKELEDLTKPERQAGARAVFANDFPVNRTREIVGPMPLPRGWIPRGRDVKLEQAILERIRREFFLP